MRSGAVRDQVGGERAAAELLQAPTGVFAGKLLLEGKVSEEKEQRVREWKEDAEMGGDEAHEEDVQESVIGARPAKPSDGGDE